MAADLICCVCDEPKGLFRTLMTREHPVCDRCYIAWYEGAGTDRDSIRKSLGIDGVKEPHACRWFNGRCMDCGRAYGEPRATGVMGTQGDKNG